MTKMEPPLDLKLRTKDFALRIIKMVVALPKRIEAQVIGKQVLRSGTSVCTNSREAESSRSRAEFIAKMGDSLKELSETSYWLELLGETNLSNPSASSLCSWKPKNSPLSSLQLLKRHGVQNFLVIRI